MFWIFCCPLGKLAQWDYFPYLTDEGEREAWQCHGVIQQEPVLRAPARGGFSATLPWFLVYASLELHPKIEVKFLKPLKNHTEWTLAHLPGPGLVVPDASAAHLYLKHLHLPLLAVLSTLHYGVSRCPTL